MLSSAPRRRPPALLVSTLLLLVPVSCRDDEGKGERPSAAVDPTMTPYFERVREDVEQLVRLVRMQPDNAALRVDLGRKLLEGGLTTMAEGHLRRALELDPGMVEARELLARNLFERQEVGAAVELVREGLRIEDAAVLYSLLGTIELSRATGDLAPARVAYDRAIELDPRCIEAVYERGRLAAREGDLELAESLLQRVASLDPSHLGAHFNLAQVVRRRGDKARADGLLAAHRRLAALEDLGQLEAPYAIEAYVALGEMRIDGGAVEEGLDELRAGVARHPKEAILRVRLALALARCDRPSEARAEFERALKEIPRDPMILNQFAWYLATRGETPEEKERALRLAEKAVHWSRRSDPNLLDTLAEARAVNGDSKGALAAITEALRLRPQDPALERRRKRFARAAAEGGE